MKESLDIMEPLNILKQFISTNYMRIPPWIDTTKPSNKYLFQLLQTQMDIIYKCVKPTVLSDKLIHTYFVQSLELNKEMLEYIINDTTELMVEQYLIDQINRLELEALELECFETLANLKKFKQLFLV